MDDAANALDPSADRALYRQLADLFRSQIHAGLVAPGALLPSEAATSQRYGLGRETVRKAIAVLRAEGLVSTMQGTGTEVRPSSPERELVLIGASDELTVRMPTPHERRTRGIAEGVPLIEIVRANGAISTFPADVFIFSGDAAKTSYDSLIR